MLRFDLIDFRLTPMDIPQSFLYHVRGVELLPGERVQAFLDAERGLTEEPTPAGRLLVATNLRVISIAEDGPTRVVQMFAADTVTAATVRNDARRGLSWRQWGALLVGGVVVYLILAYWLVDRLPDVIIPVVNLHAMAAVLMVLIVLLGWIIWRSLTDAGGALIRVDGWNWSVEVPCAADSSNLLAFAGIVLQSRPASGPAPEPPAVREASAAGS